jgi:hypothetical protein
MRRSGLPMLVLVCGTAAAQPVEYSSCAEVQRAIGGLPATGGVVDVAAGTIVCDGPLVITSANVTLKGAGRTTVFRLADHVNKPVIVIGSIEAVPSTVLPGVTIRDIAIDGNAANQDSECSEPGCPSGSLRANGLTIRSSEDVRVENVAIRGARSGGLVTELGCRRIRVTGLTSESNALDGIALYQTEDSTFSGLHLSANGAAGISTDIQFRKNTFQDVFIRDAGTAGIFMRDASRNLFSGVHVEGSKQHGLFLAQVDANTATPATLNVFDGLRVESSGGAAVRINDASCTDNTISSAILLNNAGGCLSEALDGLANRGTIVCRLSGSL